MNAHLLRAVSHTCKHVLTPTNRFAVHLQTQSAALPLLRFQSSQAATDPEIILPPASGDKKEYPVKITEIVDKIASLTLLEVADLNKLLQDRLDIKPASMPVFSNAAPAAAPAETEEVATATKTSYGVKLMKFDAAKKVPLIKEIKAIVPDMNLVQAKKFVESAPDFVVRDLSKDEAEAMKKTLEAVGATIEIE